MPAPEGQTEVSLKQLFIGCFASVSAMCTLREAFVGEPFLVAFGQM